MLCEIDNFDFFGLIRERIFWRLTIPLVLLVQRSVSIFCFLSNFFVIFACLSAVAYIAIVIIQWLKWWNWCPVSYSVQNLMVVLNWKKLYCDMVYTGCLASLGKINWIITWSSVKKINLNSLNLWLCTCEPCFLVSFLSLLSVLAQHWLKWLDSSPLQFRNWCIILLKFHLFAIYLL